jgi:hypothetical protein
LAFSAWPMHSKSSYVCFNSTIQSK